MGQASTLPVDIHVVMVSSWDWRNRIAVHVHHIRRNWNESAAAARAALVQCAYQLQDWALFEALIISKLPFDVEFYLI